MPFKILEPINFTSTLHFIHKLENKLAYFLCSQLAFHFWVKSSLVELFEEHGLVSADAKQAIAIKSSFIISNIFFFQMHSQCIEFQDFDML